MSNTGSNSDDSPVDTDDSARPRDADAPSERTMESEESMDHLDLAAGGNRFEQGKWVSALVAVLGLWMIAQAIALDLTQAHLWSDALVGVLLIAVGGYNYTRRADERFGSVPAAIVAAAAGLWLIMTPFVLDAESGMTYMGMNLALLNDLVVGLIALGLGAYSAYRARTPQHEPSPTTP